MSLPKLDGRVRIKRHAIPAEVASHLFLAHSDVVADPLEASDPFLHVLCQIIAILIGARALIV